MAHINNRNFMERNKIVLHGSVKPIWQAEGGGRIRSLERAWRNTCADAQERPGVSNSTFDSPPSALGASDRRHNCVRHILRLSYR